MVYLLALAAALASATAAVMQRIGVETAPAESSMRLSLLGHALRRPIWLLGFALLLVTFTCQAMALRFGDLSVVQPISTTELLFLVAILGVVFRCRLTWREWAGAAGVVVGLGGFLALAAPRRGLGIPTSSSWAAVTIAVGVGTVLLVAGARRGPRAWRAVAFGAAAAALFAYNASLTKATTTLVSEGWGHVFVHWEPYSIGVAGALGFFLMQNALHAGPVAASRSSMVIANPLVSVVIGMTAFGEHLRTGPGFVVAEVAAVAVLCAGAVLLARSPIVTGAGPDGARADLLRPLDMAPLGAETID